MEIRPATPRTVPRARRKPAEALDGWGLKDIAGTAALVLSELVANAVTHSHAGGHLVQTRFIRTDRGVRLEVHDASRALPIEQRARDDAEEGRGLALVEALDRARVLGLRQPSGHRQDGLGPCRAPPGRRPYRRMTRQCDAALSTSVTIGPAESPPWPPPITRAAAATWPEYAVNQPFGSPSWLSSAEPVLAP